MIVVDWILMLCCLFAKVALDLGSNQGQINQTSVNEYLVLLAIFEIQLIQHMTHTMPMYIGFESII